jgi:hypothetical protein
MFATEAMEDSLYAVVTMAILIEEIVTAPGLRKRKLRSSW